MTLRGCVSLAAHLCNLSEEFELLGSGTLDFGEFEDSVGFLVRCGNLVVSEIASSYVQLRHREVVKTNDKGEIYFNGFSRVPTSILSAKKNGANVFYKEFPDRIELGASGEIEIEYAYLPASLGLDDELPFGVNKPDERIIAYGIAAEFYLIHGQADEAVVWDKRYRDGLHAAQLKKSEVRIRRRHWW